VGFSVSGELTQPVRIPKNVIRIGLLSRFSGATIKSTETKWDLMAITSGPAPHRDIFEKEIELLAQKLNLKTLILQGLPLQDGSKTVRGNVTLVANMSDEDMAEALRSAKHLICRGGYSTIMDLIALNRSAILVPTPGQTEQEYLAEYLSSNGLFVSCHQHKMKNIDHNLLNRLPNSIEGFEVDFFPLVQF
jgi:predicted glycosyltransferase